MMSGMGDGRGEEWKGGGRRETMMGRRKSAL